MLAQVDVRFSTSTIEAWWYTGKHLDLLLHELATLDQFEQLVRF